LAPTFNTLHFPVPSSPWYIASATPNPKDVVLIVKNNNFLTNRNRLFEAADIILRTLNPRDRVRRIMSIA